MGRYLLLAALVAWVISAFLPGLFAEAGYVLSLGLAFIVAPVLAIAGLVMLWRSYRRT